MPEDLVGVSVVPVTNCRAVPPPPAQLMLQFKDEIDRMAAVLHDVVEDTSWSLGDLVLAGYPRNVIEKPSTASADVRTKAMRHT